MIGGNRVRQVLQEHRLAGTRRSDDETALTFADRSQQVHDAGANVFANRLQLDPLLRIQRSEVVEEDLVARLFGRLEVDGFNLDQGEILLAFMRRTNLSANGIAGFQIELA